jgi:short-subunit dehydrogenase
MKGSLAGRVAVVTGATSGIGLATARALARAGARLALVSRSQARLEAAVVAITGDAVGGLLPLTFRCDVSDPAAVRAMAAGVLRDAGVPDIVVNNAGIGHWGPVAELPLERLRAVLDVNFFGAVHCTQAFLPAMLERRRGTIVFVSSGFGELSFPHTAAYCASKHALNGFAKSLRAEVEARGVRVMLVLPGSTRTAFFESNTYPADVLSRYLLQRAVPPERVARRLVQALIRGRRRVVVGGLTALGLRVFRALPGLEGAYLAFVGRQLARAESPEPGARENGP